MFVKLVALISNITLVQGKLADNAMQSTCEGLNELCLFLTWLCLDPAAECPALKCGCSFLSWILFTLFLNLDSSIWNHKLCGGELISRKHFHLQVSKSIFMTRPDLLPGYQCQTEQGLRCLRRGWPSQGSP